MEPKINLNEFKEVYCTTLIKDEKEGNYYVKLPVNDYKDLECYKYYILKAIQYASNMLQEQDPVDSIEIGYTIHYLTDVLNHLNSMHEMEGITKLLEE